MKFLRLKVFLIILSVLFIAAPGKADTLRLSQPEQLAAPLSLTPYLQVMEDSLHLYYLGAIESHPQWFRPYNRFQSHHPRSTYWLKMEIATDNLWQPESLALAFENISLVDLYFSHSNEPYQHQQAGIFRPASAISPDDSRTFFSFRLQAGKHYTIFLKVLHEKGYKPELLFKLQQKEGYLRTLQRKILSDSLTFGALIIFLLYTLLSWIVSRFRPYGWLSLMIAGTALYSLSMNGYFIDLCFPEHPATGWLFNLPFIQIAFLAVFLLMMDFWQIKTAAPKLYKYGMAGMYLMIAFAIAKNIMLAVTNDYRLGNILVACSFPIPGFFFAYAIWHCWNHLNHAQRFLAYGIILFGVSAIAVITVVMVMHEQAITINPYISNFTVLIVVLLFSIGLKEELRQSEIKRNASLQRLALLQKLQNDSLEKKVAERTEQLVARNARIETLINELHHRVKNNLQLLYSLNQLQLPIVLDSKAQDILKSNISKIKAMILVNQKLYQFDDISSVNLKEFIEELSAYSERIYDTKGTVRTSLSLPDDITMDASHILSFGLIVAELLTNAYKYAFANTQEPLIRMSITPITEHTIQFVFSDNGPGMPAGRENVSMGVPLIKDLSRQLNATVEIRNDNGLMYTFTLAV
ncbi:histidine kinase dimerization/phosphoacceptor domain -containing protein [Filimonas effusa]|nr:histidine kinase dimerization/phosphoacceptor domain -containing protein [Filimonas effusa]